jgi:hypothetical protein
MTAPRERVQRVLPGITLVEVRGVAAESNVATVQYHKVVIHPPVREKVSYPVSFIAVPPE